MTTLADIRSAKKVFLNQDQTYSLVTLLARGCDKGMKLRLNDIIKNSFYSLMDNVPYWDKFIVHLDYVEYNGSNKDIPGIRKDILNQR